MLLNQRGHAQLLVKNHMASCLLSVCSNASLSLEQSHALFLTLETKV